MASIDFQSIGTWDSNTNGDPLSPGAPSGVAVGDLLICVTTERSGGETVAGMSNFLELAFIDTNGCLGIYGRIADGSANDTPSPDWTNTNQVAAVLLRYDGDVPADINDLVPIGGATTGGGTSSAGSSIVPAATAPTVSDALVFGATRKSKTATSDGLSFTGTQEFTKRGEDAPNGIRNAVAVGDWQQTGVGGDYDGDDWTHNATGEARSANGAVIYFAPETAANTTITVPTGPWR